MSDQVNNTNTNTNKIFETVLLASIQEQRRSRRWGIFFKLIGFGFIAATLVLVWPETSTQTGTHKEHVALINVSGVIAAGGEAEADTIVTGLRQAFEATKAKAVILRINSPGGSPVQSAYVYDEVKRLRKLYPEKKLYSVISDVGASGGYFIAAAGDAIYANGASIVGSIGVMMPGMGVTEAMKKLGLEQRTITAGENKMFLDPMSPRNSKQEAMARLTIANVHDQFIRAVKNGRGNRLKNNPEIFSGLFWSGEQALELGLIDGLGSASYVAREVIKIDQIVDYTVTVSILEKFSHRMGAAISKEFATHLGLGMNQSFK